MPLLLKSSYMHSLIKITLNNNNSGKDIGHGHLSSKMHFKSVLMDAILVMFLNFIITVGVDKACKWSYTRSKTVIPTNIWQQMAPILIFVGAILDFLNAVKVEKNIKAYSLSLITLNSK